MRVTKPSSERSKESHMQSAGLFSFSSELFRFTQQDERQTLSQCAYQLPGRLQPWETPFLKYVAHRQ